MQNTQNCDPQIGTGSYVGPGIELAPNVVIGRNVVIDGRGTVGSGVTIGHGTIIEGEFSIGERTRIDHHVVIKGRTVIGKDNELGCFICMGTLPQDLNAFGKDTRVVIGDENVLREYVTVHFGTHEDTVIGNKNYIMTNVTINHDCHVHNNCVLTTQSVLGGYVEILDRGYLGFGTVCHQFTRVGGMTLIGMNGRVTRDVPPFIITAGEPLAIRRVNRIGLERQGFSAERIGKLEGAYKQLAGLTDHAACISLLERMLTPDPNPDLQLLLDFYRTPSRRGIQWV